MIPRLLTRAAWAVLFAALPIVPVAAQTLPDFLVKRVPTAPDPGPLAADRRIEDYIKDGYAVVLRTRFSGRFTGCQKEQEYLFDDRSRFICSESIQRAEEGPPVVMLRNIEDGTRVLFIGKHSYVGRLVWLRGVTLNRHIHLGEIIDGIPPHIPDERRSIGWVDVTDGKIAPVGPIGSVYNHPVYELSTLPNNSPPNSVTHNPGFIDSPRIGDAVVAAPPP